MANITKFNDIIADNIEVKNTEVHNGSTTEGTVTLKLDRISGECWGGLSWDLLFPRLGNETGREYLVTQGWVEDSFRKISNTEFEFGLQVTNLDEAITFTHLLEGSSEPLVDWSLYTEDEDGGAIGVISYQNALKFVNQYGTGGSGTLRLDTEGITMSGTTYYNNGTLNLTNSTIEVNGNTGTAGQVLTSTGSGLEWRTPSSGGGGSIDTSNLLVWDPQDRFIYDLGIGSWTTGSTTWYEDEEYGDNTALQYVRIEPKYIELSEEQNSTDMFIGVYSNEIYSSGLNPYNGLLINQGILTTNYGCSSIKTKTYNYNNEEFEDLILQFPTFSVASLEEDGIGRIETIATREWVNNNTPHIYNSNPNTNQEYRKKVGKLFIWQDSDGYLHIKTS